MFLFMFVPVFVFLYEDSKLSDGVSNMWQAFFVFVVTFCVFFIFVFEFVFVFKKVELSEGASNLRLVFFGVQSFLAGSKNILQS